MNISVAICTWNRSRLLRQTLESLCGLHDDRRFTWELVVVDNNSTDDTSAVIGEFADRLPIVRRFEKRQGHAYSRNTAIDAASGDYIVWTDNDVMVSSDWLTAYHDAFVAEPTAGFFGGCIEPWFEPPGCPDWLHANWERCKCVYATRMLGDEPLELNEARLPYGANFAVRMDLQRRFRYDVRFGRVATGMLGEDETSVLRRIVRSGNTGRWVPAARVRHIVPPDRTTEDYVRAYFVGQGKINVALHKRERSRIGSLVDAVHQTVLYRVKRRRDLAEQWPSHMIRASIAWGEFEGAS